MEAHSSTRSPRRGSLRCLVVLAALSTLCLAPDASSFPRQPISHGATAPASRDSILLTCVVLHALSGDTLDARCTIVDALGRPHWPAPAESCLYHEPCGAHGPYFYARGSFTVAVPPGPTFVGVSHGIEFAASADTVVVTSDSLLCIRLEEVHDMSAEGWYSGDCHMHYCHPGGVYDVDVPTVYRIACAEDINVVNCLDNTHSFCGGPDPCSCPERIVYVTEEQRSSVYGHTAFLGLATLVEPFYSTWEPLISSMAPSVHEQPNGVVVSAHPVSTDDFFDIDSGPSATMLARTLPVDVVSGAIDGFEVLSYSNCHNRGRELDLWYRLLNCGFALSACAGTDACPNRLTGRPVGGYRVYVRIPERSLCCESWLAGLARGHTFVTNGPLITEFELSGAAPGDTLALDGESAVLSGSVSVTSALPLRRIDIVRNGESALSFCLPPACCSFDTTFTMTIDESSWVAGRVFGLDQSWHTMGDSLFAHTTPVYVALGSRRVVVQEDAEALSEWIADLEELAHERGEWTSPADSAAAFAAFAGARSFYDALAAGGPTCINDETGDHVAETGMRLSVWPNPARGRVALALDVAEACRGCVAVYSVAGKLVRMLSDGHVERGRCSLTWDGRDARGRPASTGVYLVRATMGTDTRTSKIVLLR